jgi:hypothetical protein
MFATDYLNVSFPLLPAASPVAIAAFLYVINYFMDLLYKELYLPQNKTSKVFMVVNLLLTVFCWNILNQTSG